MQPTTQSISTESATLPATANHLFPVFLKLEQLNTLLVGAGYVGHEKLQALLSNAPLARITVVAPKISEAVRALAATHPGCTLLERSYAVEDLQGRDLVVLATDQPQLHEEIRHDCPPPYTSLFEAFKEIIPTIWKQRKDPTYFVSRPLPQRAAPAANVQAEPEVTPA